MTWLIVHITAQRYWIKIWAVKLKTIPNLVPPGARMMVGPRFALLRPSFSQLRKQSLARRQSPALHQILISMGGVDLPDVTSQVIQCLDHSQLPKTAISM